MFFVTEKCYVENRIGSDWSDSRVRFVASCSISQGARMIPSGKRARFQLNKLPARATISPSTSKGISIIIGNTYVRACVCACVRMLTNKAEQIWHIRRRRRSKWLQWQKWLSRDTAYASMYVYDMYKLWYINAINTRAEHYVHHMPLDTQFSKSVSARDKFILHRANETVKERKLRLRTELYERAVMKYKFQISRELRHIDNSWMI